MGTAPDIVKEVAKRAGLNLVAEGVKLAILWSLPFLLAALAAMAGYAQSVPWMYIVVAATFVFAATATGALRISEWRSRITAQNKLIFQQVVPAVDFEKEKRTGKSKWIKKVQLCITLQNTAHFPISYVVDDLTTSFESIVNPKPERPIKGAIIQQSTQGWYRDAPIDVRRMQIDKTIFEGQIRFRIRYGFPGLEKHIIQRNLTATMVFDDKAGTFSQVLVGDVIE